MSGIEFPSRLNMVYNEYYQPPRGPHDLPAPLVANCAVGEGGTRIVLDINDEPLSTVSQILITGRDTNRGEMEVRRLLRMKKSTGTASSTECEYRSNSSSTIKWKTDDAWPLTSSTVDLIPENLRRALQLRTQFCVRVQRSTAEEFSCTISRNSIELAGQISTTTATKRDVYVQDSGWCLNLLLQLDCGGEGTQDALPAEYRGLVIVLLLAFITSRRMQFELPIGWPGNASNRFFACIEGPGLKGLEIDYCSNIPATTDKAQHTLKSMLKDYWITHESEAIVPTITGVAPRFLQPNQSPGQDRHYCVCFRFKDQRDRFVRKWNKAKTYLNSTFISGVSRGGINYGSVFATSSGVA